MTLFRTVCLSAALLIPSVSGKVCADDLPQLGDSASGYVSLQQEYRLGRIWLRQLRAHAQTLDDALLTTFLENEIFRLIPHSDVPHPQFEFVIVDSPNLNAFAVPGGIIGINFGLLLYTRDEDELSAVLAHELAHLSQRHYARQIEQSQRQEPVAIATLLASILLIATNNADAGFAGLMTSQAASIQSQLAFSRDWEQEADRIGIKTLVSAGLDPQAMSSMFEQMLQANRFSGRPPEFLLTHPVTESRVAEAADRAEPFPRKPRLTSLEFLILKQAAQRRYRLTKDNQNTWFEEVRTRNKKTSVQYAAASYNLARIALEMEQPQQGLTYLSDIGSPWNQHPAVAALQAQLLDAEGKTAEAIETLNKALPYAPESLVLLTSKADILRRNGQAAAATGILKQLSASRSTDPAVWRRLGETAGDAGQTVLAFRANGEYLFYSGRQNQALRQMELALKEAKKAGDFQQEAIISQRLQVMAASPTTLR